MKGSPHFTRYPKTNLPVLPRANCKSTDVDMVPEPGDIRAVKLAKRICINCPELGPCGKFALENHPVDGIWGGMDESQRKTTIRVWGKGRSSSVDDLRKLLDR
jgi:hypothetical protein